jgi:uncharacterized protein YlxW (UPF0749 family)
MKHEDHKLADQIERERHEIAELQEKVKQLVSRSEGPDREKRDDDLAKLRRDIGAAEVTTRTAA